jgi:hypothetical protein
MELIHAKDAKNAAMKHRMISNANSLMLSNFFYFVAYEMDKGNFSGNFFTDGEHFDKQELEFLREDLGYNIFWNSACLWYEVSWG